MRHKPSEKYSGVTIVLSNPSRFDTYKLLSGTAGWFFEQHCLPRNINRNNLDIRTADTIGEGLLPETKGLLLLGEKAFHQWADSKYTNYTLSEQRGTPLDNRWGVICIASFGVQDAVDIVDHEGRLNPLSKNEQEEDADEEEEEDFYSTKRKGATRRSNWRFWLSRDTHKLFSGTASFGSRAPSSEIARADVRVSPSSRDVIQFLRSVREEDSLYLDIETTVDGGYNIFCIGVATDVSPIYVFPVFSFDLRVFYSDCHLILQALAGAMQRATTVSHNGFAFDLPVFVWRYRLPIGTHHYDTLIAQHRCYPLVEKSLGHCMSLWTWEPYHKDEGIFHPHNHQDFRQLMEYNGKDVAATRLVRHQIDAHAKKVPGLAASILQGNRCVYPYLICSMNGMLFDEGKRKKILTENDRKMTQYMRMIQIFTKHLKYDKILLPTSPKSCVRFFHEFMNYDVVSRSRSISKKTGKPLNTPSLDEKAFWKLKLKYPDNALIDICVKYRQTKKESGMLKFEPWDFYASSPLTSTSSAQEQEADILLEGPEEMEE